MADIGKCDWELYAFWAALRTPTKSSNVSTIAVLPTTVRRVADALTTLALSPGSSPQQALAAVQILGTVFFLDTRRLWGLWPGENPPQEPVGSSLARGP